VTFVVVFLLGLALGSLVAAARPGVRVDGPEHLVDDVSIPLAEPRPVAAAPRLRLVGPGMPPAAPAELAARRHRARQTHPGKRWRP
jgi:hypothetical protein